MRKKTLLFVGMMLGLVAFALPASAMATDGILMGGATVADESASFTGKLKFETLGTGIECESKSTITVNGATVTATGFEVTTPVNCSFFGSVYKECEFESSPPVTSDNLGLITFEPETFGTGEEAYVASAPKDSETHPTLTQEFKTRTGSTSACNVTTNDLTVTEKNLTIDLVTKNGFIDGLKYTGSVRVDRGTPAQGTTTPASVDVTVAVSGTQNIDPTKTSTYTFGTLP